MKTLLIGIGSVFGDDQVGWYVINHLLQDEELRTCQHFNMTYCEDPGMTLLNLLQEKDCVYLVDAVKAHSHCGTYFRLENEEIEQVRPGLSSHAIGLGETLKLGRMLNMLPRQLIFFGMEVGEFEKLAPLSVTLKQQLDDFVATIKQEIMQNIHCECSHQI